MRPKRSQNLEITLWCTAFTAQTTKTLQTFSTPSTLRHPTTAGLSQRLLLFWPYLQRVTRDQLSPREQLDLALAFSEHWILFHCSDCGCNSAPGWPQIAVITRPGKRYLQA
ncbi:hypothetical protein PoB_007039000 [Plakobranchus ocellatus]|uniref:Uncharacterized protein n=1 Tax=Plakobranchus ocellatus TaxID=259542 RepID=A0AAV4DIB6_9GAST|nr:hypothetical protein PoB_007039000 [Plakobranchus ocellatus]